MLMEGGEMPWGQRGIELWQILVLPWSREKFSFSSVNPKHMTGSVQARSVHCKQMHRANLCSEMMSKSSPDFLGLSLNVQQQDDGKAGEATEKLLPINTEKCTTLSLVLVDIGSLRSMSEGTEQ